MQFNGSIGRLEINVDVRAFVAGAVLFALLLNLGFWQLGRADEKNLLQTRWEARSALPAVTPLALLQMPDVSQYADRRVRWQGVLDPEAYVLLDNRLHRGQVGYHVVALIETGDWSVPVNLGWLAGDPSRRTIPIVNLMQGPAVIEGQVYFPSAKPIMMQKQPPPDRLPATLQTLYWDQWFDTLAALTGKSIFPYEVRIDPASPLALVAEWPVVNQSSAKHIGYAVQWFAMATVLLLIGVLLMSNIRDIVAGRPSS
ncbi:SURF1 family protein [Luminiphilus sp.]|nr:SURF1 family protein [Luminiphilus sp.]